MYFCIYRWLGVKKHQASICFMYLSRKNIKNLSLHLSYLSISSEHQASICLSILSIYLVRKDTKHLSVYVSISSKHQESISSSTLSTYLVKTSSIYLCIYLSTGRRLVTMPVIVTTMRFMPREIKGGGGGKGVSSFPRHHRFSLQGSPTWKTPYEVHVQ